MATKLTDFFYEISPTETITFNITGPVNPRVSFDGTALPVVGGQNFSITPNMTEGLTAVHELTVLFIFPPGVTGTNTINVIDARGPLNAVQITGPNNGTFTKIEITMEVV